MTNEFQLSTQHVSLEDIAEIEAAARLERALVMRSIVSSAVSFVRSIFSSKTTTAAV